MNLKQVLLQNHVKNDIVAKHVLANGLVKLNGYVTTDGNMPADRNDKIEVNCTDLGEDREFWEAREIDEEFKIVKKADTAVFIGCSAPGFAKYCKSRKADVYVVGM